MKVTGEITNTAGYMRMTLTMSVDYQAECARCLDTVTGCFSLDLEKTVAPRDVLDGVPLDTFEVLLWIKENLAEQYNSI